MALTDQQKTDVRRYAGYPLAGTPAPDSGNDPIYLVVGFKQMSLTERLATLSATEESVLVTSYLANLTTLETAIVSASSNLDTDEAAVWKHNRNEVADRDHLFDSWRRRMCAFLGIAPGPGIGSSAQISLMRC